MNIKNNYNCTLVASFIGYITQALIICFPPLLFTRFQKEFGLDLKQLSFLVLFSFVIQLIIDLLSTVIIKKAGYKRGVVAAHLLSAVGLWMLAFLTNYFKNPFHGIVLATFVYSIGGGLTEVLISTIVEACPTKKKASIMSVLHSFYSWGSLIVISLSTLFFYLFGLENWRILAILWSLIPFLNMFFYALVPINTLDEQRGGATIKELFKNRFFWLMLLLMFCAGAGEQAIIQWISAYAEIGIKVSKTVGDLAGGCLFALLMGSARIFYATKSSKISLEKFMIVCSMLCAASYFVASLSPVASIGLLGCALCGFFVGIMWPGTYSVAAGKIRNGGTLMFALLAFGGDVGCSVGPYTVGMVSDFFGGNLKTGILFASVFPIIMLLGLLIARKENIN